MLIFLKIILSNKIYILKESVKAIKALPRAGVLTTTAVIIAILTT